jgi:hypothetical protein
MRKLIRKILNEEVHLDQNTSKKIRLAVNIIKSEFNDVAKDIEVTEYFDTPTIIVKVDSDEPYADMTTWYTEEMIDVISEITGGNVKLDYWFTGNRESEILLRVFNVRSNNKLNETFTGDTPTDITKQFINKPVKLIGDVNTTTKIQNINVNNDGSVNILFQNGMKVNSSLPMLRRFNLEVDIPLEFKIRKKNSINESEIKTNSALHKLLNMLFDGFDDIDYDWANYNCGMGECCDPYAIGFTLPNSNYDDYLFKLVDSYNYDDDGRYPKDLQDDLPEVCYESPNIKNPDFNTIIFYGLYAEEIEDYLGSANNWKKKLLELINGKFGSNAKRIIII